MYFVKQVLVQTFCKPTYNSGVTARLSFFSPTLYQSYYNATKKTPSALQMHKRSHMHTLDSLYSPLSTSLSPDNLNRIVRVELLKQHSADRIRDIWLTRYAANDSNDVFGDVLSDTQYAILLHRSRTCPMFVVPMLRQSNTSYTTLVCQFQRHHILFTCLEKYKKNPGAGPLFTVTLFDDFVLDKAKRMCLVRGKVSQEGKSMIGRGEADNVWRLVRNIYLVDNDFHSLAIPFNKNPEEFKFDLLLKRVGFKT